MTNEVNRVPKVGETVKLLHRTDGEGRLMNSKVDIGVITAVMLDGDVKVGLDLWKVVPSKDGKTVWQTVK